MIKKDIYRKFVTDFEKIICKTSYNKSYSAIVFLCIGTDRITGDCFGPLVGYKLKNIYQNKKIINIIGDLENTVQSNNIKQKYENIIETYKNPFIISVDSALSLEENIGKIIVEENGIEIGSGLNKKLIEIGNMSIKGIVAKNTYNTKCNFNILQNTHLSLIMNMADIVTSGIYNTFVETV